MRIARPIAIPAAALALAAWVVHAQPAGDATKGAAVFDDNCSECHALQGTGQGPSLLGVVGRKAGTVPGYAYSAALEGSGLVWSPANLDRFLSGPKQLIPGTAMSAQVVNPTDRRNLVAYLATLRH